MFFHVLRLIVSLTVLYVLINGSVNFAFLKSVNNNKSENDSKSEGYESSIEGYGI